MLRRRRLASPSHPETVVTLASLANLHQKVGRLDDTESVIRQAIDAASSSLAADRFLTSYVQNVAGEYSAAERILLAALEALRESRGEEHDVTLGTRKWVHDLYEAWQKPEEAEKFRSASD